MRMRIAPIVLLTACTTEVPTSVATGQLEAWTAGPSLPTPRANHCSAAIGDWVVVIGGNYKQANGEFTKTDEIHAAKLTGGALGAWQLAGHTASPVTECSATSDGERLFIIDGIYDREQDGRQVFAGTFDEGTLSTLTSIATLPGAVISSEATVRDAQLLVMDTLLPNEGDQTVTLRRPIDTDTWTTDDWGIGFRAQAEYAFSERFAYTLGGYLGGEGNPASTEVFVASIENAAITNIRSTAPLPEPVMFGEAVAVDAWVFVVGGRSQVFGGTASTKVYAAQATADGTLGAWAEVSALPMGRTNHELVAVGDFLVLPGGADAMGGDANVLIARVRN
ncbi:MAG: hypothetical protein H0V17_20070 [Deltaproteobacteria bacterium]|nr:hypothetical protein [Deltaproteobacteria bacterium]